ncbi:hypothetical protein FRB99_005075, partial [Tulasnella sp. 403]
MKQIFTKSISAVSEAGTKMCGSLRLTPRRKGNRHDRTEHRDAEDAEDDEEPVEQQRTAVSVSQLTSTVGCRHGGYFDSIVLDFGVPRVVEEGNEDDDTDTEYEFSIIEAADASEYDPSSPIETSFSSESSQRSAFHSLRRIRSKVRKLSISLRSKNVPTEPQESMSSPESSLASLPHIELEPLQLQRMSFASYASDATTGSLARYLAQRQANQTSLDKSLRRPRGMSIMAYEREGSWLITHQDASF